jgi:hypothetical protein
VQFSVGSTLTVGYVDPAPSVTCAACRISRMVREPSGVRVTGTHVTLPSYAQIRERRRRVAALDGAAGVALELVAPPIRRSPLTGRNQ